jgi:peptidoglycan/xylan/chitin deacetylase (PgdA/CDA1 family)
MKHVWAIPALMGMFVFGAAACTADTGEDTTGGAATEGNSDKEVSGDELRSALYSGGSLPTKTLSWTVDDGPNASTVEIAQYLADQGIPTTFFVLGRQLTGTASYDSWLAKGKPGVTPAMKTVLDTIVGLPIKGSNLHHLIASHTFTHGDPMVSLTTTKRQGEMRDAMALIEPWIEGKMHMLRTPYGSWSANVYKDLASVNGSTNIVGNIFWNAGGAFDCTLNGSTWSCPVGAADWACWKPGKNRPAVPVETCAQGYINEINGRGGKRGVVLTHDVSASSLAMIKAVIPQLKAQGYSFVRLDQVPEINADLKAVGGSPATPAAKASVPAETPSCREGGVYCGGIYSKIGGEKDTLYRCVNGHLSVQYHCADTCKSAPSGTPDSCTSDGASGP